MSNGFSCIRHKKFLSRNAEMHNPLLTICLLYIFIEEFSQVDVFLREKIEQETLVCIKDPFKQLFFEGDGLFSYY